MKIDVRHHRVNVAGKSVEDFADEVGVTPDVIRHLEKTGNRPQPGNAITVARYFKLVPDEMWPESATDQPLDNGSRAAA